MTFFLSLPVENSPTAAAGATTAGWRTGAAAAAAASAQDEGKEGRQEQQRAGQCGLRGRRAGGQDWGGAPADARVGPASHQEGQLGQLRLRRGVGPGRGELPQHHHRVRGASATGDSIFLPWQKSPLTEHLPTWKPQNPSIDELYEIQNRRLRNRMSFRTLNLWIFKAFKLWNV